MDRKPGLGWRREDVAGFIAAGVAALSGITAFIGWRVPVLGVAGFVALGWCLAWACGSWWTEDRRIAELREAVRSDVVPGGDDEPK